jgi:hypothetical protein
MLETLRQMRELALEAAGLARAGSPCKNGDEDIAAPAFAD